MPARCVTLFDGRPTDALSCVFAITKRERNRFVSRQSALLNVYRRCVQLAVGSGLNRVPPVRAAHQFMLRRLRPESVEVFGQTLYLDTQDSLNLSIHGIHEPDETRLIQDRVSEGDVALDLGAHIGYFTLLLAQTVGPGGSVFAFEPHPDNAALLKRSVDANHLEHVVIEEAAVAGESGNVALSLSRDGSVDHRILPGMTERPPRTVQAWALDDYFTEPQRVDFIKMDLQGAEGLALKGMHRLIGQQDRLTLMTEFEPWGLEQAGTGAHAYLTSLAGLGFVIYDLNGPSGLETPVDPDGLAAAYPPIKDRFTNLLCVKSA